MVKALSPKDIAAMHEGGAHLPDFVKEAINEVLVKNFSPYRNGGGTATIKQGEVIAAIIEKSVTSCEEPVSRNQIFKNKWLDFESFFEAAGWKVSYDSPGFNESYEAYWIFKA